MFSLFHGHLHSMSWRKLKSPPPLFLSLSLYLSFSFLSLAPSMLFSFSLLYFTQSVPSLVLLSLSCTISLSLSTYIIFSLFRISHTPDKINPPYICWFEMYCFWLEYYLSNEDWTQGKGGGGERREERKREREWEDLDTCDKGYWVWRNREISKCLLFSLFSAVIPGVSKVARPHNFSVDQFKGPIYK